MKSGCLKDCSERFIRDLWTPDVSKMVGWYVNTSLNDVGVIGLSRWSSCLSQFILTYQPGLAWGYDWALSDQNMKRSFFNPVLAYNSKVLQDGLKGSYPTKFHESSSTRLRAKHGIKKECFIYDNSKCLQNTASAAPTPSWIARSARNTEKQQSQSLTDLTRGTTHRGHRGGLGTQRTSRCLMEFLSTSTQVCQGLRQDRSWMLGSWFVRNCVGDIPGPSVIKTKVNITDRDSNMWNTYYPS